MFRFYASDPRFPGIEVGNEGDYEFRILKNNKHIDSFHRVETPMLATVSLAFAEKEAKEFFNKLEISTMLKQIYERA